MERIIQFAQWHRAKVDFKSITYAVPLALITATPAYAARESIRITPLADLRFGSFAVMASGSRTVGANGTVQNNGIAPVSGDLTGPASFELTYDKGNKGKNQPQVVVIEVTLLPVSPASANGLSGALSGFTTDLPNAPQLQPGQPLAVSLTSCARQTCTHRFQVGGTINVARTTGGGTLSFALPLTANLISVDGNPP